MCPVCKKPYYISFSTTQSIKTLLDSVCNCSDDIKVGWVCGNCSELWYINESNCDCGKSIPDQRILFIDSKVESTRSTLRNVWVALKNLL